VSRMRKGAMPFAGGSVLDNRGKNVAKKQDVVVDGEGLLDVVALIEVFWRYRILVAGFSILGAILALYLAYSTPNIYEAEAVVTPIMGDDSQGLGSLASRFGGIASLAGVSLQGGNVNTIEAQAILQSRNLAETFIARNKLEPVILGASAKQSLWVAVDRFRRTVLKIRQDREKGTTEITMRWKDQNLVARWANQYVALANEILRVRAIEDATRNIKFLNEQIGKTSVVEIQKVMYGLVENETKNYMLASTRVEYAFAVVDPAAAPEDRVWPRRTIMLATGIAVGFVIGALLALAHSLWRRRRRQDIA
jgi:uncharacterized protein involved in exopolysaccharide biosynthesis